MKRGRREETGEGEEQRDRSEGGEERQEVRSKEAEAWEERRGRREETGEGEEE